ncbi:MAG: chromate transporter [Clostridiales bacterium]|nr:chromate transporter [Clostridiales bacterium]
MSILPDLFLTFAKIGLFTFGGGYAMIPLIEHNCVDDRKWITHDEMMDVTVVAEATPGPIAINCATYVGFRQAGFAGALIATAGIVAPSFMIIYAISMLLDHFLEITLIAHAFKGIKIAVGLLILEAAVSMTGKMQKKIFAISIMICSFAFVLLINIFSWNFSSFSLMLVAAAVSLVVSGIQNVSGKGGSRRILKKNLSPVLLICISACMGMLAYGI